MTVKKRKAPKAAETANEDFQHDAIMLRTTKADGTSHNGFQWTCEVGAIVKCPDWNVEPVCGGGLHGYLDGLGSRDQLSNDHDALWWIVGVKRSEVVAIDGDKSKAPRAKVIYFGDFAGALSRVSKPMIEAIMTGVMAAVPPAVEASLVTTGYGSAAATTGYGSAAATTGYGSAAATTGYGSAAATTGYGSAAATTGDRSAAATTGNGSAAATTGDRSAAATTGDRSAAATTGKNSISAALGPNSTAKAGLRGAITLTAWVEDKKFEWHLVAIRSSMVGENGIEPGVEYRLTAAGEFERVGVA